MDDSLIHSYVFIESIHVQSFLLNWKYPTLANEIWHKGYALWPRDVLKEKENVEKVGCQYRPS